MINFIVRPVVYNQYRHVIHSDLLLIAAGRVQREGDVINRLGELVLPLSFQFST